MRFSVSTCWSLVVVAILAHFSSAHNHDHHHHQHDHDHLHDHHGHVHDHSHHHNDKHRHLQFGTDGQFESFQDWVASADFQETNARCGTPDLSGEELEASEEAHQAYLEAHKCDANGTSCAIVEEQIVQIETYWHDIRRSDGSRGSSDATINDAMTVLNQAYQSRGFAFQLVGIIQTNNDLFHFADLGSSAERQMKTQLRRGTCATLNVYSNGVERLLGWASFPGSCTNNQINDGTVINYQTSPGGLRAPYNLGDTLVHEVGHWLGLFHTFQGGCNGAGDLVADTPPEARPDFICEVGRDTCGGGGLDDVRNYMNYGTDQCINRFTAGQNTRMNSQWNAFRAPFATGTPFPTPAPSTPSPTKSPTKNPTPSPVIGPTPPIPPPTPPTTPTAPVPMTPEPTLKETPRPTNVPTPSPSGGGGPPGQYPTVPPTTDHILCFSNAATVSVLNRGFVQMDELKIGDEVLTSNGYQPIYGFAHKENSRKTDFLQIYTNKKRNPLEISEEHLVFLAGITQPVPAKSIVPGHVLASDEGQATVTKITTVHRKGLFAPLTLGGTIVVDGIVSSCYVSLQKNTPQYWELDGGVAMRDVSQHFIAHIGLAPVRMMCLGISSELCNWYNEDGLARFVELGFAITNFMSQQTILPLQVLLLVAYGLFFGPFFVLEWMLGPKVAMYALITSLLLVVRRRVVPVRRPEVVEKGKIE